MIPDKQAFPIVARERGDDGRKMPHLQITCRECGNHDYSVISAGTSPPPAMTNGIFRKRGWNVGHKRSNDMCPACNPRLGQAKAHSAIQAPVPVKAPATIKEEKPVSEPVPIRPMVAKPVATTLVADPPRQPALADRRKVMEALEDHYEVEVGYRGNASDASVAQKLDVPRAWVSSIRELLYGPEQNAAMVTIRADLKKLISQGRSLEDRGMVLAVEGETLRREAERLAQTLGQAR